MREVKKREKQGVIPKASKPLKKQQVIKEERGRLIS